MNEKRSLLYSLGEAIRRHGKRTPKRHGSEWRLRLPSGIEFIHDDYNKAVRAYYPDGTSFYFGMDFGSFTGDHVSVLHYKATIELIEELAESEALA